MPQLDNMPIMAQSGEYVVRKEAVDKLGKPMMDMINNVDRLGYGGGLVPEGEHGHSAIDELLAINTLNNQSSMEKARESAMMQEGGFIVDGKPATKEMAMERQIKRAMMNPMEFIQEQPRIFDFMKSDSPDTLKSILMDRVSNIQKTNKLSEKESSELIKLLEDAIYSDDSPYSDLIFEREMGMKEGGEVEYSIGVVDPLWNALEKLDSIDELVQSQAPNSPYDFSKYQRSLLDVLDEAGEYTTEDALKMLDEIAKGRAQGGKMHRTRFQDGGTVSFAGSESNLPTLEELYSMAGVMPVGAQKEAFEKAFEYDPSRESSTVAGYMGQMGDLGRSGTSAVGQAGEATRAMGVGFAGSGAGGRELSKARRGAQASYVSGIKDTQRRMFEDIRGDRESYIQNALAELNRLEGLGGTQEYRSGVQTAEIGLGSVGAPSQPPQGSETGGDTIGQRQKGSDGQTYEWNGSVWVLVNDADLGGSDDESGYQALDYAGTRSGGVADDYSGTSGTFP